MKTYQTQTLRIILAKMTSLTATKATLFLHTLASLVSPPILGTTASTLMATRSRILSLGPLYLAHHSLILLRLVLHPKMQLNLLLLGSSNHIIKSLAARQAHKLTNIIHSISWYIVFFISSYTTKCTTFKALSLNLAVISGTVSVVCRRS